MKISRRKFLKIAGLGGAAAVMNSPALFPQNNNKLNSVIDPDYPFPMTLSTLILQKELSF